MFIGIYTYIHLHIYVERERDSMKEDKGGEIFPTL